MRNASIDFGLFFRFGVIVIVVIVIIQIVADVIIDLVFVIIVEIIVGIVVDVIVEIVIIFIIIEIIEVFVVVEVFVFEVVVFIIIFIFFVIIIIIIIIIFVFIFCLVFVDGVPKRRLFDPRRRQRLKVSLKGGGQQQVRAAVHHEILNPTMHGYSFPDLDDGSRRIGGETRPIRANEVKRPL